MSPTTTTSNGVVTLKVSKDVENPLNGKSVTREATVNYPELPAELDGILSYFGNDVSILRTWLQNGIESKLRVNASLELSKSDEVLGNVKKAVKALVGAGLDEETAKQMVVVNPVIAKQLNDVDFGAAVQMDYSADEMLELHKPKPRGRKKASEAESEPGEAS